MREHRRYHRVRPAGLVSKTGILFADPKSRPTACGIVDLSAGGACIEVHGSDAIPQRFILNHGGVQKSCRVVWQTGRRIGVTF
jgi:hypothetical protein